MTSDKKFNEVIERIGGPHIRAIEEAGSTGKAYSFFTVVLQKESLKHTCLKLGKMHQHQTV